VLTLSLKFRPVKKSDGTIRQSVVPQSVSICVAWYSHGMRGGGKGVPPQQRGKSAGMSEIVLSPVSKETQ
jgi:hypothetical protein